MRVVLAVLVVLLALAAVVRADERPARRPNAAPKHRAHAHQLPTGYTWEPALLKSERGAEVRDVIRDYIVAASGESTVQVAVMGRAEENDRVFLVETHVPGSGLDVQMWVLELNAGLTAVTHETVSGASFRDLGKENWNRHFRPHAIVERARADGLIPEPRRPEQPPQ